MLEGGMIRLETLIELKCLDSRFSSSNFPIRVFRAYPLIEIRQTVPCRASRAIRGSSISVSSTRPPLLQVSASRGGPRPVLESLGISPREVPKCLDPECHQPLTSVCPPQTMKSTILKTTRATASTNCINKNIQTCLSARQPACKPGGGRRGLGHREADGK